MTIDGWIGIVAIFGVLYLARELVILRDKLLETSRRHEANLREIAKIMRGGK